jgi:hypothetical protein
MEILGPVIVVAVLALVIFLCGRTLWKDHKAGGSCGGCTGCSGGSCGGCAHQQQEAHHTRKI